MQLSKASSLQHKPQFTAHFLYVTSKFLSFTLQHRKMMLLQPNYTKACSQRINNDQRVVKSTTNPIRVSISKTRIFFQELYTLWPVLPTNRTFQQRITENKLKSIIYPSKIGYSPKRIMHVSSQFATNTTGLFKIDQHSKEIQQS